MSKTIAREVSQPLRKALSPPRRQLALKRLFCVVPGSHHSKKKGPSFALSREDCKGFELLHPNGNPGPGTYEVRPTQGKSFILRQRVQPAYIQRRLQASVGPGVYNLNQSSLSHHRAASKPTFAKAGGPRFTLARGWLQSPGPGFYKVGAGVQSKFCKSPQFRLSQTLRTDITAGLSPEHPGPGSYSFSSQFGSIEKSPKLAKFA